MCNAVPFQEVFPDNQNANKEGFIFLSVCLSPKSKGAVSLERSKDGKMRDVIQPNYLKVQADVDCLKKGKGCRKRLTVCHVFNRTSLFSVGHEEAKDTK